LLPGLAVAALKENIYSLPTSQPLKGRSTNHHLKKPMAGSPLPLAFIIAQIKLVKNSCV